MVKRSLLSVGQKQPITQYVQLSFINSVSVMFQRNTSPSSSGPLLESDVKLMNLYNS